MVDEADFLPADKHKSFLQDNSITLGARNHTCPKYQNKKFYNIFAIFQRKREGRKLIFCLLTNVEDFFKVVTSF